MSNPNDEIARLRQKLAEATATLDAIRRGEVDAVMVRGDSAPEVFRLQSADLPFHQLVEQMAEGALSIGPEHEIVYCNGYFCELVGLPCDDLEGQPLLDFLGEDSRIAFLAAVRSKEIARVAADMIRCDGKKVPVQLAITPPGIHSPRRTTVVVSDMTATRTLTRAVEARAVAEAESMAKDRFLAVLGHELRNPLAALASGLALLQGGSVDAERRAWVYDRLTRQVRQLKSLVDDLLDTRASPRGRSSSTSDRSRSRRSCGRRWTPFSRWSSAWAIASW